MAEFQPYPINLAFGRPIPPVIYANATNYVKSTSGIVDKFRPQIKSAGPFLALIAIKWGVVAILAIAIKAAVAALAGASLGVAATALLLYGLPALALLLCIALLCRQLNKR